MSDNVRSDELHDDRPPPHPVHEIGYDDGRTRTPHRDPEAGLPPSTAVNRDTGGISSFSFEPVYTISRQPRPLNRDGTPKFTTELPAVPPAARHSDYPASEPTFQKDHELLQRVHSVFYLQDEHARIARGEEMPSPRRSHRSW